MSTFSVSESDEARALKRAGRLDWWWAQARQITLCATMARKGIAQEVQGGECPVHGGDACLFVFAAVADIERVLSNTERNAMNEHSPHFIHREDENPHRALERLIEQYEDLRKEADAEHAMGEDARRVGRELMAENASLKEQNEALTKALTALIGWSDGENGDDFGTTEWANARALVTNPAKERE